MTFDQVALRRVVQCLDGRRVPLNAEERSLRSGTIPYWGAGSIVDFVDEPLFAEELVLLGEDGAPFFEPSRDVAFLVREPVWVNNHIHALRPRGIDARFLTYALNVVDYGPFVGGSTRDKLTQDDMMTIPVPLPPLEEQRRIADFLDDQVARIDEAMVSRQLQIEQIAARSAAGIETLVLGREPEARDNDARGPVLPAPTHWEVRRNRRFLREVADLSTTGAEEMLTVSHLTGITPRSEKNVNMFEAESTVGYKLVRPGDLVVNTMWAWMGALGVSLHEGIVSPAYGVYRFTDTDAVPGYFHELFRSRAYVAEMTRFSKGVWSSRLRLYPESFLGLESPFPPRAEQQAIADQCSRIRADSERQVTLLETSLPLLDERKRSLITAAVTGQLDVTTTRPLNLGAWVPGVRPPDLAPAAHSREAVAMSSPAVSG